MYLSKGKKNSATTTTEEQVPQVVLQARHDGTSMVFTKLSGEEFCRIKAKPKDRLGAIFLQLKIKIGWGTKLDVVLPEGVLLSDVVREDNQTTVSGHFGKHKGKKIPKTPDDDDDDDKDKIKAEGAAKRAERATKRAAKLADMRAAKRGSR